MEFSQCKDMTSHVAEFTAYCCKKYWSYFIAGDVTEPIIEGMDGDESIEKNVGVTSVVVSTRSSRKRQSSSSLCHREDGANCRSVIDGFKLNESVVDNSTQRYIGVAPVVDSSHSSLKRQSLSSVCHRDEPDDFIARTGIICTDLNIPKLKI